MKQSETNRPGIKSIPYAVLGERLSRNLHEHRVPATGSIELTERCNLNCVHCYINKPANDCAAATAELTRGEWSRVLGEAADEGLLWLLISGGEPLIRPDFLDIYIDAKKKGLLVSLFTNATAVTEAIADGLAQWPPYRIEVTLYGASPETYERITGVPGSYERCIRGIELLLKRKLSVKLKTMAMTLNRHELDAMKRLASELGVPFTYDALLSSRLNGDDAPCSLRLSAEQAAQLDADDPERRREWEEFCARALGTPQQEGLVYQCGAGLTYFHIDAYGHLSPCMLARTPSCDLRAESFAKAWRTTIRDARVHPRTRPVACDTCGLAAICDQCPGWALMEHGDHEEPVEYLCRIAHLRAEGIAAGKAEAVGGDSDV